MRRTLTNAAALAAAATAIATPAAGARPAVDVSPTRSADVPAAARAAAPEPIRRSPTRPAPPTTGASPARAPHDGGSLPWVAVLVPLGVGAAVGGVAFATRAGRRQPQPPAIGA